MGVALDAFLEEHDRVGEFDRSVKGIRQRLDDEALAADDGADRLEQAGAAKAAEAAAAAVGTIDNPYLAARAAEAAATAAAYAAQAKELRREAEKSRADSKDWEEQRLRVYVLRLVTAFEVFLRDFVVERASANEGLVRDFLRSSYELDLRSPLDLSGAADAAERVAAFVDATQEQFSDLGRANAFYTRWFGEGRGFLSGKMLAPPLDTDATKAAATADLHILFQLRHILVHKSGVPNRKYHDELRKHYNGRLCPDAFVDPSTAKSPEAVLSSPAAYQWNETKMDDFYESLMNLARHIDAAYP